MACQVNADPSPAMGTFRPSVAVSRSSLCNISLCPIHQGEQK